MPLYEACCPDHGLFEEFLSLREVRTNERGNIVLPCPSCGEDQPQNLSGRGVLAPTVPGGVTVSGSTFPSMRAAERHAEATGKVLVDTASRDFRALRTQSREGVDAWFQTQGYRDKEDFGRRRKRNPWEAHERAQAAQERKEKTGSTDSSGINARLKSLAAPPSA